MRYLICLSGVLLLASMAISKEAQSANNAASRFQDLVRVGNWVELTEKGNGYTFRISLDKPRTDDTAAQLARARFDVKQVEFDKANDAERKVRGSVGRLELQRLKANLAQAKAELEHLERSTRGSTYRVVGTHDDYLVLRSEEDETFIPWSAVFGITRRAVASQE